VCSWAFCHTLLSLCIYMWALTPSVGVFFGGLDNFTAERPWACRCWHRITSLDQILASSHGSHLLLLSYSTDCWHIICFLLRTARMPNTTDRSLELCRYFACLALDAQDEARSTFHCGSGVHQEAWLACAGERSWYSSANLHMTIAVAGSAQASSPLNGSLGFIMERLVLANKRIHTVSCNHW
jgi:hypothetical protein